ncbi:hypothetical protein [Anatilimnocola floriformis]|uniref:hypothetical protein n=1 Tax=Anatilimnocola floriformis TaxID=2948575 RepID=UPI0020C51540|nr:hypothetical protein [Anatilimnocola floriformis]
MPEQQSPLVEQGQLTPPAKGIVRNSIRVALMDGSVVSLPRTISAKTARAICTRGEGDQISEDDLKRLTTNSKPFIGGR